MLVKTRTHSIGFTTTEYFREPNSKSKSNTWSESLAATGAAGTAGQMYFVLQSPVAGSNKVGNGHVTTDPFICLVLALLKQKMYWVQSVPYENLPSPFWAQISLTSPVRLGGAAVVTAFGHEGKGRIGKGSFGHEGIVALHGSTAIESSQAPVAQVSKDKRSIAPFESHLKYWVRLKIWYFL